MKKLLLLAGLAVAATVSCSKNETFSNGQEETPISFTPLAATQTKSTPIKSYKTTTGDFKVYAWYQATATSATFDPSKPFTLYMNNVTCSYKEGDVDNNKGEGSWQPKETYFWPKNGKLTFSAYYPAELKDVSVNEKTGIQFPLTITDAATQTDIMYSNRVFDRTSSTETDVNENYDGVDLVFNHALSAANFLIKTDKDYGTNIIKVYSIKLTQISNYAVFQEKYTNGTSSDHPTPIWDNRIYGRTSDYTALSKEVNANASAIAVGDTLMFIPQPIESGMAITVEYGIKYGTGTDYLKQTATLPLTGHTGKEGDNASKEIKTWEMGKWYHYTLTFTLDTVYFAPSVTDWEDVIMDGITIE